MARKPRKRGRRTANRRIWPEPHEVHLYAWLDYCMQHEIDFNTTIINHLEEKTSREFSLRQVERKLKKDCHDYGREGSNKDDIYREGISCLDRLKPVLGAAITQAIDTYGEPSLIFRLRGTSTTSKSSSKTLSVTRQGSQNSSLSTLSVFSAPDLDILSHETISRDAPRLSEMQTSIETGVLRDVSQSVSPERLQMGASEENILNKDGRLSNMKEESTAEVECPLVSPLPGARSGNMSSRRNSLKEELSETRKNLHETKTRATKANQDQAEALATLQHENSVLRAQVVATQNYKSRVQKAESCNLRPGDDDIWNECILIEGVVADVCSDLETLLDRLPELNVSPLELLRSIVAVSVCALVFESPFPELMTAPTPILDHYRKQIHAQVVVEKGKELSRHLYRIMAKFLVIPGAGTYGEQHSPLSAVSDSDSDLHQAEADVNPSTIFEEIFQRSLRLKTNLFLCGGRFQWVFYQPGQMFDAGTINLHGWAFDGLASAMKHKGKGRKSSDYTSTNKPIKLCLFPALYRGQLTCVGLESRVVFEESHTPASTDDLRNLHLIAKAVVLVVD
ncbi:hypothetical protein F4801DRAFT_598680 [Xylaria longipes]|nr:hypothetical protein F4801DRAFT_598680 [Xylaria longipes]